jgi:hypothetical protein
VGGPERDQRGEQGSHLREADVNQRPMQRIDARCLAVYPGPQAAELGVDAVQPVVNLVELPVDLIELPVDLVEPLVDLLEPLVDLLEPLVDLVEPLVHAVESLVDSATEVVEALIVPCRTRGLHERQDTSAARTRGGTNVTPSQRLGDHSAPASGRAR